MFDATNVKILYSLCDLVCEAIGKFVILGLYAHIGT